MIAASIYDQVMTITYFESCVGISKWVLTGEKLHLPRSYLIWSDELRSALLSREINICPNLFG